MIYLYALGVDFAIIGIRKVFTVLLESCCIRDRFIDCSNNLTYLIGLRIFAGYYLLPILRISTMATKTPVTTLLNLETHQALETLSRRDDRPISQIIREAVVKYIANAA
jgi:hypothetical protein